jgi:hypothetical protein
VKVLKPSVPSIQHLHLHWCSDIMINLVSPKTEQNWQQTCETAVTSIVSILYYFPRAFDTEGSYTSDATGFVVDAGKGIILTNRVSIVPNTSTDL